MIARHPEVVHEALTAAQARGKKDRGQLRTRLAEIDESLEQSHQRLRHVVEAIATGGADVLGDELREKAARIKEEKQQLLVEREKLRRELLRWDQGRFDAERLLAAITRFHDRQPVRFFLIPGVERHAAQPSGRPHVSVMEAIAMAYPFHGDLR